jgi:hypothetical protein
MRQCPLLAQSGHSDALDQCPLLGVKRTSAGAYAMLTHSTYVADWVVT